MNQSELDDLQDHITCITHLDIVDIVVRHKNGDTSQLVDGIILSEFTLYYAAFRHYYNKMLPSATPFAETEFMEAHPLGFDGFRWSFTVWQPLEVSGPHFTQHDKALYIHTAATGHVPPWHPIEEIEPQADY